MYKQNLFKLIRSEEVVIWAGAGLSMYAGFPSGKSLGEVLINSLSDAEQKELNHNSVLPDLVEDFVRIKGGNRNALIKTLNKIFVDHVPTSLACHTKIASIPHFKTIITTNYDSLFEQCYKQNCQVILSSKHVTFFEKEKIQIFKVHGDLSDPDSIILAKADYNNFFKNNVESDIYWTVIKEKLATKNVLFLGYNLEDPNISVIFDKILDVLGANKKEYFLVCPDLSIPKIRNLESKGIHYINSTAEFFIDELLINIKENIIDDFDNKIASPDVFRSFLSKHDILPDLVAEQDSFKLSSLRGVSGKLKGSMNLTFKDSSGIKDLHDFIFGDNFGEFELTEEKLTNLNITSNGIKLQDFKGLSKLIFTSQPKIISEVDLRFSDGFEFNGVPVELYTSNSRFEIHVKLKCATLKINFEAHSYPETNANFKYMHKEICANLKDEIEFFNLLKRITLGQEFNIYTKSGQVYTKSMFEIERLAQEADTYIKYFNNLKIIENHFNVRFLNIKYDTITNDGFDILEDTVSFINTGTVTYDWDEDMKVKIEDDSQEFMNRLKSINELSPSVMSIDDNVSQITIHDQKITLGYKKIEILNSYISNLDSVINKKDRIIKIKSRKKEIIISYIKDKTNE